MRKVMVPLVVLVAVVGLAAWWFLGRDDAPPVLAVDDQAADAAAGTGAAPRDLDGRWTVVAGGASQAGMRIDEDRFGGLDDNTAVGRTPTVDGSIEVEGTAVDAATFSVDLRDLEFSDDPGIPVANRSVYLRTKGLETDRYPTTTFELTEPIELSELPRDGSTVTARATGTLELHGVAREVSFSVDARLAGDRVQIATAEPVTVRLADHDIEAPEIAKVSKVADTGSFEFLVVLRKDR